MIVLIFFNILLLAKCQDELEQCRASCYERHHVETVVRGKQGPRGIPGPEGPAGPIGPRGHRGAAGTPGKDCGVSSFGVRVDDVESRLVAMETKAKEQRAEIEMLKNFKEENNRPENCDPIKKSDDSSNDGIFGIFPFSDVTKRVEVWCDMTSSSHGWTVIQRRIDGSVDFDRDWSDYVGGFGDKNGEYWLGLDAIHRLTRDGDKILRIEMKNSHGDKRFAEYESFYVGPGPFYRLEFDGFTGNAGNSMTHVQNLNGMKFTTRDRDNDNYSNNCATNHNGWWYNKCFRANLNGQYRKTDNFPAWRGIIWYTWLGDSKSLREVVMKIRPRY